ncbi:hypothetical protein FZEAL_3663 [Fusarium zealandicum]|uniref:Uncharacterized protein n=1 Tax=Fusarium zealandicum TaxID=1053134 RepID=A0A8H4UNV1_9HYPO|nr:hypothetical protein FZEAL_3663 [Fusarium zealandicum]
MSQHQEVTEVLPSFVSSIGTRSPVIYFHHIIDADLATLTVQVLGMNLTLRFSHNRAKRVLARSSIQMQLENKTVGFLALAAPSSQRVVLAAAESGHGAGRYGDMLDPQKGVLSNKVWTMRVVAFGKTLGMKMGRPFDSMNRAPIAKNEGIFLGSHVEVKLAVHGICVLLEMFGITKDLNNVTIRQLRQLRAVRWEDGSRPVLEVYFSRKHCHPCRSLVRNLEEQTGVTIRLLWKHRLVPKIYPVTRRPIGAAQSLHREALDTQDFDFGDVLPGESDVETIPDDDDEDDEAIDTIDLTNMRSASPPAQEAQVDAFIDGLAYRVGQMEASPAGAAAAIVEFATAVQRHNTADISKPLPATPAVEPPAWMLGGGERHTYPRAQRTLFANDVERARSASPSAGRGVAVRERSPRRYNIGSLQKSRRRSRERAIPKTRARPRTAFY